ncbi:glycine cleavage system protein GcvH [Leeuwenhoekiella marinoflava]|jgi:glycine cleavage system H protein|uniref:Glycine cleavage system H protein n=2 Tax=Leeuwenhoekiella marinoflava TaxID=988 RepID=A0A4V1KSB8_9FLAO|nr:glycine cleavage system protein GcvH [Leeuwenhoekiella marinoflava]RXG29250.1 glycine cleavage system H protein [Leeuwenhoekiella marinoflava]SHF36285.1 glycine cleavage system H protein [Leeuwenhoekiella marinoflava DSM 3653]|tara:strand:- start:172 stop:552 length:381 start_codon:yes stop_codon:yes gene_type:complete
MEASDNLYFSKEHTWIKIENDTGTVGITTFAQSELGEIVYIDLPNLGDEFEQDEVFGSVEALKTVSDLFMPLSGEITAVNENLLENPTLVNDKPFSEGWMVKIQVSDLDGLSNLLSYEAYQKSINK